MFHEKLKDGLAIVIPSWNNADYLVKCLSSIAAHAAYTKEVVVHLNEDEDLRQSEWIERFSQDYELPLYWTRSENNIGICKAFNLAMAETASPIVAYFNDDMVALPDWEQEIYNFAKDNQLHNNVWLSPTMIEPRGDNPCCLAPMNYGENIENFKETSLLADLPQLKRMKGNVRGTTWPPMMLDRKLLELVGGFSEDFSPGFGSDPDLAHKLYDIGVKDFIGVGRSLVYHFGSKTTSRDFIHNDSEAHFFEKYGETINEFCNHKLKRGTLWKPKNV